MSQNTQAPQLYTITSGQTLTINLSRSVSVLASGGTATIVNSVSQTMTIPDGTTLEMNADTGNTLSQLVITAQTAAYIVTLSGNAVIS
jgi:hypothetical protein